MRLTDADLLGLTDMEIIMCDGDYKEALKMLIDKIEHAPTIEPERKTGEWIERDDSWDGVYYECSSCGEPWTTIDGTPWDNGMNYCPHCGAKMEKGEEE